MIIYFVWAIILTVHRKTVISPHDGTAKEFAAYDGSNDVYNPTIDAAGNDFHGDQEEL